MEQAGIELGKSADNMPLEREIMPLSETREVIAKRLAEYASNPNDPWGLTQVAERLRALPVYMDMGGALFLTLDGDVLRLNHYDGDVPTPELDSERHIVAAVAAAEKYPELAPLVPERPASAEDCSACGGTGRITRHNLRCGECTSLGWKHAV
jgi:hypothetical protein